jgi:hypothetical protein
VSGCETKSLDDFRYVIRLAGSVDSLLGLRLSTVPHSLSQPLMIFMRFNITLLAVPLLAAWSHVANAQAPQNWSRYYPPPVKVAALSDATRPAISREQNIARASHLESMPPATGYPQFDHLGAPYVPAPPHLVLQAPPTTPAPHLGGGDERPGVGWETPPMHGHTQSAMGSPHHSFSAAQHLPELPGVENDPSAAGPGRLGMGTHWLQARPPSRPMIPQATVAPTWKTPYSYGYFGAPSKRHWTRQNGYRDRSLQWTLR